MFHENIESLTFDPRYWGWNGQIKMANSNVKLKRKLMDAKICV
jgi:hypothetical protein